VLNCPQGLQDQSAPSGGCIRRAFPAPTSAPSSPRRCRSADLFLLLTGRGGRADGSAILGGGAAGGLSRPSGSEPPGPGRLRAGDGFVGPDLLAAPSGSTAPLSLGACPVQRARRCDRFNPPPPTRARAHTHPTPSHTELRLAVPGYAGASVRGCHMLTIRLCGGHVGAAVCYAARQRAHTNTHALLTRTLS
jgi:hypothetical protein